MAVYSIMADKFASLFIYMYGRSGLIVGARLSMSVAGPIMFMFVCVCVCVFFFFFFFSIGFRSPWSPLLCLITEFEIMYVLVR